MTSRDDSTARSYRPIAWKIPPTGCDFGVAYRYKYAIYGSVSLSAEAEQGDQGEVQDRPGGGAQDRPVAQGR